jgi:benzodiazapine receptor
MTITKEEIMSRTKQAWINAFLLVATLVVNGLGSAGLINGLSQKEISDMYITLITPSPSTFSIWGVIYVLLIASLIMMIVKKDDTYYQTAIDKISRLFRISCILNIIWIVTFSYLQIALSTLFIFGFVVALSTICMKLLEIDDGKHFLLPLTFGIYTGWVFIATVVNIAAALVKANWGGFGIEQGVWAGITLLVSLILVFLVGLKIRNAVFPLPIAWAYFGIYKYLKAPEGFKGEFAILQSVVLVGMAVLIVFAVIQFYQNKFKIIPSKAS